MTRAGAALRRRALLPAFLAAVAFALGHQITYVVEYGANAGLALARSGHELDWTVAVASIVGLSLVLGAIAVRELFRLSRQAREITLSGASRSSLLDLARGTLPLAITVFAVSLVAFVVVENIEYAAAGLASPGLTLVLSPEHQQTLLVFELVSLAVAFVAALYRWRRDILVELIALAQRLRLHGRTLVARAIVQTTPAISIVRSTPPGRAPPLPC